jgi:hypothetical protein
VTRPRTFIIRVNESPARVVIEDVRERRRAVAADLASVGAQITAWLEMPAADRAVVAEPAPREDSVSRPT